MIIKVTYWNKQFLAAEWRHAKNHAPPQAPP